MVDRPATPPRRVKGYTIPVVREIVDPRSGRPVQQSPSQRDRVVASLLRR